GDPARADLRRFLPNRSTPVPRLPRAGGDPPAGRTDVAGRPRRVVARVGGADRVHRVRARLAGAEPVPAPEGAPPPPDDRRVAPGADRPARGDARGGCGVHAGAADGVRADLRAAGPGDPVDDPGAVARSLDARGARELV